jgi:hypothetical protein
MRFLSLFVISATIVAPAAVNTEPIGHLTGKVEPVLVEVTPSSTPRRYVAVQDLEFSLIVQASCPANMRIDSVSVTTADTSRTISGSDFDEQTQIETTLIVPRRQVAAIAIDDYCREDKTFGIMQEDLQIDAAYTATLSLRCINDEEQSIVYQAQPLSIILSCVSGDDDADPSINQESSETSTTR